MKKLLLGLTLLFTTTLSFAQHDWCGTDHITKKQFEDNPSLANQVHESILRNKSFDRSERVAPYEIPVVFHIIHDNGIGNIGMDQIEDALRVLNEDYNRTNADAVNTRDVAEAPFLDEAADCQITFKLAKRDPSGQCTNGVLRVNAPGLTYNANDDCKSANQGGSGAWPRDRYLNIWVVNTIGSTGEGTTLGYAYLPYSPNGNNYGILIRNDRTGTIGTSNSDGRTLTHEMGHTLGLLHPFNGGCDEEPYGWGDATNNCEEGGDYCCDTPPVPEATWSCNTTLNTCDEVNTNDHYGFDANDQIENYMSYNSCQNMFSKDQRDLMHNNLDGNINFLEDLVSAGNIAASGINEVDQLCKADFILSENTICAGNIVSLMDDSYHAPTNWTWAISGTENVDWEYAAGSDANSQNPEVNFILNGSYTITLLASDGANNDTEVKNDILTVLKNPGASLPYSEGFEDYSDMSSSPFDVFVGGSGNSWQIENSIGATGSKSAKLSNFGVTNPGQVDELISETIDLSGVSIDTNVTLTFKYAYKKRSSSNDEWLKFWISNDCGASWFVRKNIHGSALSEEIGSGPFTPVAEDWKEVWITNISSPNFVSNFRYKFTFENDNGNNIYLDDINLEIGEPTLNVESFESSIGAIEIYPNPAETVVNLNIDLLENDVVQVQLLDVTGRIVQSVFNSKVQSGSHQFSIERGTLGAGTYFINVVSSKGTVQKRVVFK